MKAKLPRTLITCLLLAVLVAAPYGANAQEQITTVKLATQNNSGVFGGARITSPSSGEVRVELTLEGGDPATPMPAHIHKGSCANLDPKPAFPLNSVSNGASDTTVAVSIDELAKGGYAINVHKSAAEASVYVACGDIVVMEAIPEPTGTPVGLGGGTPSVPGIPSTGRGDETSLLIMLLAAFGFVAVVRGAQLVRYRVSQK